METALQWPWGWRLGVWAAWDPHVQFSMREFCFYVLVICCRLIGGLMFLVGGGFIVVLNQGLTLQRPVWPRNHYATQAGLELKATLLPQPPKCWHKLPYLIFCFGLVFETAAQTTLQLKTFSLLLECWDYRHVSAWLKTPSLFIYLHLFGFVFCCVLFGGYDLECEWRSANNLQH